MWSAVVDKKKNFPLPSRQIYEYSMYIKRIYIHLNTYNIRRDLDYLTNNSSIFVGQKGTISLIFNV